MVKLVIDEPESAALREALRGRPKRASSVLTLVELPRAIRRADRSLEPRLHELIPRLTLIELTRRTLRLAARLEPPSLRTLDAIHIGSALSITPLRPVVITYDQRLAAAARAAGLVVEIPA